jgi:hypothetical protein
MTNGRPAKKWPAGRSPFAGIARIRSLGVAVQPLSCPRPLSLSSRLRISPEWDRNTGERGREVASSLVRGLLSPRVTVSRDVAVCLQVFDEACGDLVGRVGVEHPRKAAIAERQALGTEAANYARLLMAAMLRDPAKTP